MNKVFVKLISRIIDRRIRGMNFKKLIFSKTFWTGVGLVGYGAVQVVQGDSEGGVRSIFEGFGLIFLRDAIAGGK
jgi:hypothetical protein